MESWDLFVFGSWFVLLLLLTVFGAVSDIRVLSTTAWQREAHSQSTVLCIVHIHSDQLEECFFWLGRTCIPIQFHCCRMISLGNVPKRFFASMDNDRHDTNILIPTGDPLWRGWQWLWQIAVVSRRAWHGLHRCISANRRQSMCVCGQCPNRIDVLLVQSVVLQMWRMNHSCKCDCDLCLNRNTVSWYKV